MARSLTSLALILALAGAGLPSAVQAKDGQSVGRYRVQARVPVACWVRPAGTVLASPGRAGSVVEACNAPGGFSVSASYRPLADSERASLYYGGRLIDLSKSGEQHLRRSSLATIRTVDYEFGEVQLAEPLVLSLTIQPL